jgi:hypothetical protein
MAMTFYEVKDWKSALVTYTSVALFGFLVGMYKGCDAGYDNGYRQAVNDVFQSRDNEEVIDLLVERIEKEKKE